MIVDILKGIWRLYQPLRKQGFISALNKISAYQSFWADWKTFKKEGGKLQFRYIAPILRSKNNDGQSGGGHYFYQDIWALKTIKKLNCISIVDIGSRYDGYVGQATIFTKVISVDIRPPNFSLDNFQFIQGDLLNLPFENDSIDTLSCLHTLEHIGLGRYGDKIDPEGTIKSIREIGRVVKPNGNLIISFPIGKERVEFNAQRILNPMFANQHLTGFKLIDFSVVDDNGKFIESTTPENYINANYACGMYHFVKN